MAFIKAWKTKKKGLINYKAIGDNEEETLYSCNQGFTRKAGMIKNLKATAKMWGNRGATVVKMWVKWTRSARSKVIISQEEVIL